MFDDGAGWPDDAGWPDGPGVLTLPSGRRVRGRSLRGPRPAGPVPQWAVYAVGHPRRHAEAFQVCTWSACVLDWPDFRAPRHRAAMVEVLRDTWRRAAVERVEVGCPGGVGRTGTLLAALAVLDGLDADDAVALVRRDHHPRAVETWLQRRFLRRLARDRGSGSADETPVG